MVYSRKNIFFIALTLGALNMLPLLAIPGPGGDIIFHYTLIDCFSKQLWQGNIYPRWCMEAEAGLGSLPFLFYFPLPYYVAAMFYPLRYFGVSMDTMYLALLWTVNTVTIITCWHWLKDIISPGRALLVTAFFLFMPYRMELMAFRSAYAELWCVALLPLLFLFTRRLIKEDAKNWVFLAGVLTLCLLTHVPATLAGLLACGLQILFFTGRDLLRKIYFTGAVLLAGAATLFYTLPANYFVQYLYPEVIETVLKTWANSYVTWEDVVTNGHIYLTIGLSVTAILTAGLSIFILRKQADISDPYIQQESKVWIITAILAFFLLFRISDPLWQLVTQYITAAFPWRMQILIICAATYLLAIKSQWLMSAKQLKTWKADYIAAVGVTALFGLFVIVSRDEDKIHIFNKAVDNHLVQAQVYRTRWTDKEVIDTYNIYALAEDGKPRIQVVGKGMVTEQQWDWRGIVFNAEMSKPGTIRLKHFYFPIWKLKIDGSPSENIAPERHSGLMLVRVPAGTHQVQLHIDINAAMGWLYSLAKIISLIAITVLIVIIFFCRSNANTCFDNNIHHR
jgi:hypothetical protein